MSDKHDNVIILGAGFSADAGIPLLKDFIPRMIEYRDEKRTPALCNRIRDDDKKALEIALDIREKLDSYHGRISFDDENIEDILSLLAWNALVDGANADEGDLKKFIDAISATIELSYRAPHQNIFEQIGWDDRFQEGQYNKYTHPYQEFWGNLFQWCKNDPSRKMPTIISFNYDLVLERSLTHMLMEYRSLPRESMYGDDGFFPFDSVTLDYNSVHFPPEHYNTNYYSNHMHHYTSLHIIEGTAPLERLKDPKQKNITINILKLHGSLNYPSKKSERFEETPSVIRPVKDPYIIPPVSNKSYGLARPAWELAMTRLRKAKNVIFVGYSLPKTDGYMQFFLKAALGPNHNLKKIYVFDPVLWDKNDDTEEMQNRYKGCFSQKYASSKIDFNPSAKVIELHKEKMGTLSYSELEWDHPLSDDKSDSDIKEGTMRHFVAALGAPPDFNILY